MVQVIRFAWQHPSAILVGGIIGLLTVLWWPLLVEFSDSAVDSIYPVIRSETAILSRTDTEVTLAVKYRKTRDCRFKGLQAYSVMPGGHMRNAEFESEHYRGEGITRPVGNYEGGQWRIWPTNGAAGVVIFVQHDCGKGRLVTSKLAEARL
jgi:hypothetical protein